MGVQRNAEGVLVVRNSTLWVSAMFGVLVVILIGAAFSSGEKRLCRPAAVMAGFAVLCMSKYTFVFDATQRTVRWQTMRFGRRKAGSMPFDAVNYVVLQSEPGKSGRPT